MMNWWSRLVAKIKVYFWPWVQKFAKTLFEDVLLPGLAEIGRKGVEVLMKAIAEAEASGLKGTAKLDYAREYARKHLNTRELFPDDKLNVLLQNMVSAMKSEGKL